MGSHFKEIEIPIQKHYGSFTFPAVLTPNSSPSNDSSHLSKSPLSLFIESIKAEKQYLESLLHKAGAVLFRGFPTYTASDFNDVVEAFGYKEFNYDGAAPRTKIVGRVYTANESPPEQEIKFHNEMASLQVFPSKLFFFCEVQPLSGGETPIVLGHVIYERIKASYPFFIERLEEHGLTYNKIFGEEDDPSRITGRGWKSMFSTNDKTAAEERAANLGMKLEWLESGVRVATGLVPGIRYDHSRKRKVWFNSTVYLSKKDGESNLVDSITFGNGESLPYEVMIDCLRILDEESVAFPWRKGDILLIDNMAVLHGRTSCNPPRRILASLCV